MLENAIEKIVDGISIGEFKLYSKKISKGRFRGEFNLDIYLQKDKEEALLLHIKVFYGLKPHYKQWVEFFNINKNITLKGKAIEYFDSIFEEKLLSFFSNAIEPGGKIYVEYYEDRETLDGLSHSFPAPVTRLGYKLFNLGFTWFKDWYFPEGWLEGGEKLQGEKPLDEDSKNRQTRKLHDEISRFLERTKERNDNELYVTKAVERARNILNKIEF